MSRRPVETYSITEETPQGRRTHTYCWGCHERLSTLAEHDAGVPELSLLWEEAQASLAQAADHGCGESAMGEPNTGADLERAHLRAQLALREQHRAVLRDQVRNAWPRLSPRDLELRVDELMRLEARRLGRIPRSTPRDAATPPRRRAGSAPYRRPHRKS